MRRFWLGVLGLLLLNTPTRADELGDILRELEKEIAQVRGLAFKQPVTARIVPRGMNDPSDRHGYYDPATKTLVVYGDVKENYAKGVLVHEMVHALQDQHFDLTKLKAKLHQESFSSDAEMALAALIEGDATLTMIELMQKEQPKVSQMLAVPLDKAKNRRNAFLYGQGARYVKALKDKGGWASVNQAYRFPPRSTASILHLKGVSIINLGPGKSRGPFAIFDMLADQAATRDVAMKAALAWRGDRVVEDEGGRAWVLAAADDDQAKFLRDAIVLWYRTEKPMLESIKTGPGFDLLKTADGGMMHLRSSGPRVIVVAAPSADAHEKLRDRIDGPLKLEIVTRDKQKISFGELIDRLLAVDVVCVGEDHDSELHHRLQLELIKALYARDERLGVGLEMFQKPFQKTLDRYVAGTIGEKVFLEDSEYLERWGYDWSLYRPIVEFCRRNQIPLAALNAPRELTKRAGQVLFAALSDEEKKQLGPVDFHVKEHRAWWYEKLAAMHGQKDVSAEQKEKSYQVMTIWDDVMAQSAAKFHADRNLRRMVVLAGSGHIDRDFGIPNRTARHGKLRVASVHVVIGTETADPTTDYLIRIVP